MIITHSRVTHHPQPPPTLTVCCACRVSSDDHAPQQQQQVFVLGYGQVLQREQIAFALHQQHHCLWLLPLLGVVPVAALLLPPVCGGCHGGGGMCTCVYQVVEMSTYA